MRAGACQNLCDASETNSAIDTEIHILVFVMFAYFCTIACSYLFPYAQATKTSGMAVI